MYVHVCGVGVVQDWMLLHVLLLVYMGWMAHARSASTCTRVLHSIRSDQRSLTCQVRTCDMCTCDMRHSLTHCIAPTSIDASCVTPHSLCCCDMCVIALFGPNILNPINATVTHHVHANLSPTVIAASRHCHMDVVTVMQRSVTVHATASHALCRHCRMYVLCSI